ncbi:unnamed protein product, partial [Sphacelaria rigidula]
DRIELISGAGAVSGGAGGAGRPPSAVITSTVFDSSDSAGVLGGMGGGEQSSDTSHHASKTPRFFSPLLTEDRARADSLAAGDWSEHAGDDNRDGERESASLRLDAQDLGPEQSTTAHGWGNSRGGGCERCDDDDDDECWVPVDPYGDIPLSLHGWAGSGLVVGLAPHVGPKCSATEHSVSATPPGTGTPLSHTFSAHG